MHSLDQCSTQPTTINGPYSPSIQVVLFISGGLAKSTPPTTSTAQPSSLYNVRLQHLILGKRHDKAQQGIEKNGRNHAEARILFFTHVGMSLRGRGVRFLILIVHAGSILAFVGISGSSEASHSQAPIHMGSFKFRVRAASASELAVSAEARMRSEMTSITVTCSSCFYPQAQTQLKHVYLKLFVFSRTLPIVIRDTDRFPPLSCHGLGRVGDRVSCSCSQQYI